MTKSKTEGQLRIDSAVFQRMATTILHAVSTDTTRAHLSSLHVVSSNDRLVMEGTDGVCLAIWEAEGDFSPFDILIPRDRVAAFLHALPKPTEQQELFDDGFVRLERACMTGSGVRIEYAVPEAVFPDVASRIPKRRKGGKSPAFKLHHVYLAKAAAVFRSASKSGCAPLIEGGETGVDAIRFSSEDAPGLLLIIMPLKFEDEDDQEPGEREVQSALAGFKETAGKAGATVTLSVKGGKSVTLTPETGKALKADAKKRKKDEPS